MFQIDRLLKKHFWIVCIPQIAMASLLNAQAVTQLVGISVGPNAKALAAAPPAERIAPPVGAMLRSASADPILDRNPFDHVTGRLRPPSGSSGDGDGSGAGPIDPGDPWSAPKCEGGQLLVIAASDDPDWSFAAFGAGDGKSVLRRMGGDVNGKKVHFVGADRVWMSTGASLCQRTLFDKAETHAHASMPAPAASSPSTRGKPLDPSITKGIQRISPTEYRIDRGVVDKILESQVELTRARAVPELEDGHVVGIRLMGVKADSLLATLGLKDGDRLQTINGFELATPEKVLEAYARLRTADRLTISLKRDGKNMNIDYDIR